MFVDEIERCVQPRPKILALERRGAEIHRQLDPVTLTLLRQPIPHRRLIFTASIKPRPTNTVSPPMMTPVIFPPSRSAVTSIRLGRPISKPCSIRHCVCDVVRPLLAQSRYIGTA